MEEKYEIETESKTVNFKEKVGSFLDSRYFVAVVIILLTIIAFALGRISGLQDKREAVRIINNSPPGRVLGASTSSPNPSPCEGEGCSAISTSSGQVVASKNGTKYHYPWCAGAKQISAQNIITFNSTEEARAKGYTPASNCKGLK
jgi:hypothetical protein